MSFSRPGPKLDHIGMTASILCAIHCAVVPLLITSLPFFGLGFLANPWLEWGMIIFALLVGIYAISFSFLRHHRKWLPLILLISGFAIIVSGHLFVTGWHEAIVVPIGGLMIAAAHVFNYRYTAGCKTDTPHYHFGYKHE